MQSNAMRVGELGLGRGLGLGLGEREGLGLRLGEGRSVWNMPTPDRTISRCLVCGSTEVRTDEVVERGIVFLAECAHCDHRWTSPLPEVAPDRRPIPLVRFARRGARSGGDAAVDAA